jgi:hypothetical protein
MAVNSGRCTSTRFRCGKGVRTIAQVFIVCPASSVRTPGTIWAAGSTIPISRRFLASGHE